jgi:deoxyribodipyrimidine photo-lyase
MDLASDIDPTPEAARRLVAAVRPAEYARWRNYIDGPVTHLSPYLTHGILRMPDLVRELATRYRRSTLDKLLFEFAWREFYHHVWRHEGEGILADLGAPISRAAYADRVPDDVREGRTGLPVMDASLRELYGTGYLHNHQRMWLASYLVHLRKVHWRPAADWMYGHLLDGDLASNHLSWQWVAGTFSRKPYLFNADNVARYAPLLASPGTVIDHGYDDLDRLARGSDAVGPERSAPAAAVSIPSLLTAPPGFTGDRIDAAQVAGRRIALVHPWWLGERPPADLAVGVLHLPFHARFPWSSRRWRFVLARMRAVTDLVLVGDLNDLVRPLAVAREVTTEVTLNPEYREAFAARRVKATPAPRFTPDPAHLCRSFSRFWREVEPTLATWFARESPPAVRSAQTP